ncbi:MAG: hypothetical protein ACREBD_37430, partial [Blastocatellia bacterium]
VFIPRRVATIENAQPVQPSLRDAALSRSRDRGLKPTAKVIRPLRGWGIGALPTCSALFQLV